MSVSRREKKNSAVEDGLTNMCKSSFEEQGKEDGGRTHRNEKSGVDAE